MNELGAFVFYRTYSRWLPNKQRRETWKEVVTRSVNFSMEIAYKQVVERNKMTAPIEHLVAEAEALFDNIFNLRQFLSGRTHWVGGAEGGVAWKYALSNFNCSFINIKSWEDLGELFYMLMIGTGVGLKSTKEFASNMKPFRTNYTLAHMPYTSLPKEKRLESTELTLVGNEVTITIGDSKEGWVEALNAFFRIITEDNGYDVIKINYDSIRPKGERLLTFGGTASGHEPLREMFEKIDLVLRGEIDPSLAPPEPIDETFYQVRPVHILDIANLIGHNVVVGGVRRTAEIFLMDEDDWECILAKYGINGLWDSPEITAQEKHAKVLRALESVMDEVPTFMYEFTFNNAEARPLAHRQMSNNSIAFTSKPSREKLNAVFTIMQNEGEPGFVNLEEARRRRPNAEGLNPCAEILLDSYGVCNLTTVNVDAFVVQHEETGAYRLDFQGLMHAQALSARAGIRMTCIDLELPNWDAVQKRDRLIGTSLTGWKDAMGKLGYNEEQERNLLSNLQQVVRMECLKYAHSLRIPVPLLDTTVKPEGTLSQVAGGVSSGLHVSHAPYFIRRIRINATDALAKVAKGLGWTIHAEVGTNGYWDVNELRKPKQLESARTLVIDFPIKSTAIQTRDSQTVKSQFDTYFAFQEDYTAHNSSNTISVRPEEWGEAESIVWDNWDNFVGVSFLSYDGGSYVLAPYEEITEERYNELKASMTMFDEKLLERFENDNGLADDVLEGADGCEGGVCPIR